MKVKKIQAVLLTIGLGFALLAVALFFVTPIIVGSGFEYSGLEAFSLGFKAIFSFNFNTAAYTLIFVLFCISVICGLVWLIFCIVGKRAKKIVAAIFSIIAVLLVEVLLMAYFVPEVKFNGKEGKLLNLILTTDGQTAGKILTVVVLAFIYISIILLTIYAFVGSVAQEKQEPIIVKEVVKEVVKEYVEPNPLDGLDSRKAREEAFFKSCLDTGEFEQYDEVELTDPILSDAEVPVFELSEVEETDQLIKRQNFIRTSTKTVITDK